MELVFVRHGESEANAREDRSSGFFCGRWDCELTERGRQQARSLKGSWIVSGSDAIFSSSLKRALATAACFADRPVIPDARLVERTHGDFDGRYRSELEKIGEYRRYFTDKRFADFRNSFTRSAPNGETYADVVKRVTPFLEELRDRAYKKVIIVSHFGAIRCMLKVVNGLSEEETLALHVYQCEPIIAEW